MLINVDPTSAVPAFEQVRSQLAQMIGSGTLPVGYRLPPIRQLATDLSLAPGTVARVYRELEAEGLVRSRVRHGTTVQAPNLTKTQVSESLDDQARTFAATAARLGFSLPEALNAVKNGWPT